MEDITEPTTSAGEETKVDETKVDEQDPLKVELDKVKKPKSEAEKAKDNLFFNAKRVKELGMDPAEILGIKNQEHKSADDINDDDKPVTLGMFKKMQQENATKTALQLADDIPNETERELTRYYLENRIVPSGDPAQDLADARGMVNSKKNAQILEEANRKTAAKTHSSASSAPANHEQPIELTEEEVRIMRFGGLTKEEVIKARKK